MKKFVGILGFLMLCMGLSSGAFAREVRIIDNPSEFSAAAQKIGAIQSYEGKPVIAVSDLAALVYDYALSKNMLSMVREQDRNFQAYTARVQARNPVLASPTGAVKVSDLITVAKGEGIWLPSDELAANLTAAPAVAEPKPAAVAPAPQPVADPRIADNAARVDDAIAKLSAMKEAGAISQKSFEARIAKILTAQNKALGLKADKSYVDKQLKNKVETSVFAAFLQKFGLGEGQKPVFAKTTELDSLALRVAALEKAHQPPASESTPSWWEQFTNWLSSW
jgi:hypothetical protein